MIRFASGRSDFFVRFHYISFSVILSLILYDFSVFILIYLRIKLKVVKILVF